MWSMLPWSSLNQAQKVKVCRYLRSGDEFRAWATWADMRMRYPVLCGPMPPKPWVAPLREWCYSVSEWDTAFSPIAFRWDCPPRGDALLGEIVTMVYVSDYAHSVATEFRTVVGALVDGMGTEVGL